MGPGAELGCLLGPTLGAGTLVCLCPPPFSEDMANGLTNYRRARDNDHDPDPVYLQNFKDCDFKIQMQLT